MNKRKNFRSISREGIKEEVLTNLIFSTYLEKNIPLTSTLSSATSELLEEGPIKEGLLYHFHLAQFYAENSQFFIDIGDPELPLSSMHYFFDDFNTFKAHSLVFNFDEKTYMCDLKIPNILGYNEPTLDPDYVNLETILSLNEIPFNDYDRFDPTDHHRIHNMFLFSSDIDIAIDKGYSNLILDYLDHVFSLEDHGVIYRFEIIDQNSQLHLNNFFNRRSDLDKSSFDQSFLNNMTYKYNILVTTVYSEFSYPEMDYVCCSEIFKSVQSFIDLSKVLKNIKKDNGAVSK